MNKNIHPSQIAGRFLKETARRPFTAFLVLLAVGAAGAALAFFSFQAAGFIGSPSESGGKSSLFGDAKEKKYREVFKIRQARENDYASAVDETYPDVFLKPLEAAAPTAGQ